MHSYANTYTQTRTHTNSYTYFILSIRSIKLTESLVITITFMVPQLYSATIARCLAIPVSTMHTRWETCKCKSCSSTWRDIPACHIFTNNSNATGILATVFIHYGTIANADEFSRVPLVASMHACVPMLLISMQLKGLRWTGLTTWALALFWVWPYIHVQSFYYDTCATLYSTTSMLTQIAL